MPVDVFLSMAVVWVLNILTLIAAIIGGAFLAIVCRLIWRYVVRVTDPDEEWKWRCHRL